MNRSQSRKTVLILVTALLLATLALVASQQATFAAPNAQTSGCTIPPSGPWPACATGGTTAPTNNNSCVIPPSGPWPACARSGGATAGSSGGSGSGNCVIPPSGPWPACARSGNANGGSSNGGSGDCIIPPSGPWPACAKNGTSSPIQAPEGFCPDPNNPQGGHSSWLPCESFAPVTPTPQPPTQPKLCPPPNGQGKWVLCGVTAGAPTINSFWGTVTPNGDGSDTVELTWDTQGGHQVNIIVGVNFIYSPYRQAVEASGTTTINYDSDYFTKGNIGLQVCDHRGSNCQERLIPVTFSCERNYFFNTANYKPGSCAGDNYQTRDAVYQQFENGFAIWIEDWKPSLQPRGAYVLFFLNGQGFTPILDTWKNGEPVNDPILQVPTGKHQPTYGIGKAWRSNEFIRNELGWAVSAEQPYTAESMAANNAPIFGNSTSYLSIPNNNKVIEFSWGRRSHVGSGYTVHDL